MARHTNGLYTGKHVSSLMDLLTLISAFVSPHGIACQIPGRTTFIFC